MGCWSTRGRGLVASRNESSDSRNNWKLIWIEEWTQRGLLWLWVVMGFCKQYYRATFSCTNTKRYKSTCSKDAHFGVGKRKKKSYVLDNSISVKGRRPKYDLICTSELSSLRYGKKPSLADSLSSPLNALFSPKTESLYLISGWVVLQSRDFWKTEQQTCHHLAEMREVWKSSVRYRTGRAGGKRFQTILSCTGQGCLCLSAFAFCNSAHSTV